MPIPVITSAAATSSTVGAAFTFQVTASNTPTAYKAEFLPPQLQINTATGLVWGTAELSGTFAAKVYASNASGTSDPFVLTITVAPVADATGSTLAPVPPSTNPLANGGGAAAGSVTPTISTKTTNGTIAAGSRSLTFIFSPDFAGSVLGTAYAGTADQAQSLTPPPGSALSAVAYTVTAGSMRVVDIR